MAKKSDDNGMIICIGPAELIRKNFREAMVEIESAKKILARTKGRPKGAHSSSASTPRTSRIANSTPAVIEAWNSIGVALELLLPIFDAVEGRSPPPPRKPSKPTQLTAAQTAAVAKCAQILKESVAVDADPGDTLH